MNGLSARAPVDKIIGQLDDLGLPPEAGRPTVRKALEKAGIKVENTLLSAAIYKRKIWHARRLGFIGAARGYLMAEPSTIKKQEKRP